MIHIFLTVKMNPLVQSERFTASRLLKVIMQIQYVSRSEEFGSIRKRCGLDGTRYNT